MWMADLPCQKRLRWRVSCRVWSKNRRNEGKECSAARTLLGPFRNSPRAKGAWPGSSEVAFESAAKKLFDAHDDEDGGDDDDDLPRVPSDDGGEPTSAPSILSGWSSFLHEMRLDFKTCTYPNKAYIHVQSKMDCNRPNQNEIVGGVGSRRGDEIQIGNILHTNDV